MIQFLQPVIGDEELKEIVTVFQSKWLGKGQGVTEFERRFASRLQTDHQRLVSTTCGTEAIFVAGDVLDYRVGDEIIAPSISFIAVGSSVVAKGATLVLCDVDRSTLNIDVGDLERKITPKTKAVIVTHYGGVPCDMDEILALCSPKGIAVIEDAACATASRYKGKACGTLADIGIWSFEAGKLMTTGDGGMAYFKSTEHVRIAKEQLYLGLSGHEKSGMDKAKTGSANWWEVEIERPGRRAIMNNIAAAIGLVQLEHLDQFVARRKAIHSRYRSELTSCSWLALPPLPPGDCESSHYFFWIQLNQRDELAQYLRKQGVYSTFRYWPLHKVRYFGQTTTALPNAEYASRYTLNLPLHHGLSDHDVGRVIHLIKEFASQL